MKSRVNEGYGEINNMFVDNNYRGYGIGKQLINCFKEYCKSKNINNLIVAARPTICDE